MRSPARILFVLFTLLLTVQGEPVLGARTKVIVRPAAGRSVPEEAYGICLPVRLSCDGVAVCGYDAQLPTGERVAALSADELAARGVPRLDDVVRQWRGRDLRLFLELCPSAAEPLSEEEHAERELILRRADAATCGAFAAADASCGCCALAEIALRTAYGAGFRQGDVWLIADDAEVFARYGGRSSKVPLCGLSPEGTGRGGVRGLFLHRMRVGSKSDVKRLRKGGRRIVVWDVNSAGDAAAMRAYGVDFIVTDDPEVTAVHTRVTQILRGIDPRLSIHDFRMVSGPHHANVIFDMVIPAEYEDKTAQLRREVEAQLQDGKKVYHLVITFDTAAFNKMTKEAQD